jgi:hypothetical protein
MILDWQNGTSQSGFGHPSCKGGTESDGIIRDLSKDFPTGPRASLNEASTIAVGLGIARPQFGQSNVTSNQSRNDGGGSWLPAHAVTKSDILSLGRL